MFSNFPDIFCIQMTYPIYFFNFLNIILYKQYNKIEISIDIYSILL